MYTPDERSRLRSQLLDHAAGDRRISGAAITGSAAGQSEDRWSDIDLALGVADASELPNVLADWTALMYREHAALHHLDVNAGAWIYRVFFLPSTLQIDVAFVPQTDFRALAPTFRLVSGTANEPRFAPPPEPGGIIGLAWLYALHVRSSLARGKVWQAEYMISGMRDHVLALACIRHGLSSDHGRGIDRLPKEVIAPLEGSLVQRLEVCELWRAFGVVTDALLTEVRTADAALAERLECTLLALTSATDPTPLRT